MKPIIFSTEMVKAILEDRKTQTRRLVKPQPILLGVPYLEYGGVWCDKAHREVKIGKCPYGSVGNKLWVRESHRLTKHYKAGTNWVRCEYRTPYQGDNAERWFAWDDIPKQQRERLSRIKTWGKWRPGRFMYYFTHRLELDITDEEVERLQEITDDDAKAEGCKILCDCGDCTDSTPRGHFQDIWRGIHGYDSWDSNPFVWVIEFKMSEGH